MDILLDQLTEERTRKGSLEQRGIAVISTSGTLVAIVLGFVSLATRSPGRALPAASVLFLVLALAPLFAAAAIGLLMNVPAAVPMISPADLVTDVDWDEKELQAQMLTAFRRVNRLRVRLLTLALGFEVLALGLLAVSALFLLVPQL